MNQSQIIILGLLILCFFILYYCNLSKKNIKENFNTMNSQTDVLNIINNYDYLNSHVMDKLRYFENRYIPTTTSSVTTTSTP